MHNAQNIEDIFKVTFFEKYNTLLIGGADEPLYQPSVNALEPHKLYYREDYFSSALHEISHWCIAGEKRRSLVDFGYWYTPEGRDQKQQAQFESVEVKPQTIEWFFSVAAAYPFRLSIDNFSQPSNQPTKFAQNVKDCALKWCKGGVPQRGLEFTQALQYFYNTMDVLDSKHYSHLPR